MANKKLQVIVIGPEINLEGVGGKLVKLTEAIAKIDPELVAHGFLGGEFGYGADYENDVFMMHPFCYCEEPDCDWCVACDCEGHYKDDKYVEEKTCDYHLGKKKPKANFLYKPTGAKVIWHKAIGRDMEFEGELSREWLENCLKSLVR